MCTDSCARSRTREQTGRSDTCADAVERTRGRGYFLAIFQKPIPSEFILLVTCVCLSGEFRAAKLTFAVRRAKRKTDISSSEIVCLGDHRLVPRPRTSQLFGWSSRVISPPGFFNGTSIYLPFTEYSINGVPATHAPVSWLSTVFSSLFVHSISVKAFVFRRRKNARHCSCFSPI